MAPRSCRLPLRRFALLIAVMSVATAAQAQSTAAPPRGGPPNRWVIETGQESLVLAMLGGETSVGGCHLENADIPQDHIEATYTCGGADRTVRVLLTHRPDAGCSTCTAKFAIEVRGSDAPAGFAAALTTVVRAREGAFRWTSPITHGPRRRSVGWVMGRRLPVVVFVLLLSFLLIRAFVRKDDERRAEGADDPEQPPR